MDNLSWALTSDIGRIIAGATVLLVFWLFEIWLVWRVVLDGRTDDNRSNPFFL